MTSYSDYRVLSGIQPSGNMHLGNYLGAIMNWVEDQERYESYFMIADYHAITTTVDPNVLRSNKRELVGLLLACGLDPQKVVIFSQSSVYEHVELCWVLACLTPIGWLNRMIQYKERTSTQGSEESVGAGIFLYPALMAADILLYQANAVPVGEDQRQHIELTRDIAQRFNHMFGETFTMPEPLIRKTGARIMSLTEPSRKMSKSDNDAAGRIGLLDSPDEIESKVMQAKTDSDKKIAFDVSPVRAGVFNLLTIYQTLTKEPPEDIEAHFVGQGYADLKGEVADLVIAKLEPVQQEYVRLMADSGYINEVLENGAFRARKIASQTMKLVRERIGVAENNLLEKKRGRILAAAQ